MRVCGRLEPSAPGRHAWLWEVFRRAEVLRSGSQARLEAKARPLVGGPTSRPPPPDRSVYAELLAERQADVFLTYCTNATLAAREVPSLGVVSLPAALAVGADYGLTILTGPGRRTLAAWVRSYCQQRARRSWPGTASRHPRPSG